MNLPETDRVPVRFSLRTLFLLMTLSGLIMASVVYPWLRYLVVVILITNMIGWVVGLFMNNVAKLPTDGGHWDPKIRDEQV